jgi:hypothetical protein
MYDINFGGVVGRIAIFLRTIVLAQISCKVIGKLKDAGITLRMMGHPSVCNFCKSASREISTGSTVIGLPLMFKCTK